jgi:hypothetical protein
MPAAQQDFSTSLFRTAEDDPRVDQLVTFLAGRSWLTAADLAAALHFPDRLTRSLAEASDGRILSGQKGYKLTRESTPDEMLAATNWLESQGKRMIARAVKTRRAWHSHQPDHRPAA